MLKLERSAAIARTADGLTHHNRLVVPEFGVVELRLEQGGASSLSHRLPGSKTPRDPGGAGTDTFHFAPGPHLDPGPWTPDAGRHDRVKLKVHLYNPFGQIKHAWLELFVRREKSPVWRRELKGDELLDGERELEFQIDPADNGTLQAGPDWDGSLRSGDEHELKKSKRFPDGYVTVEHSPYKLRLTVEGEGLCRAPVAWTYFHVLIDKIELEWGTVDMVPTKRQWRKDLFNQVLTDGIAPTANQKIHLVGNQFMANGDRMFDNTLYEKHRERWGRGPKLPVLAKVFVRSCTDAPVLAPRALGHTQFLWDWESKSATTALTFVDQATNYKVDKTHPKGRNCHADRGGKRSDSAAVFPAQAGTDPKAALQPGKFPFKVAAAGKPRDWAAFTEAWREGVLAAKTGVVFQPSRMAGDKFKFTCHAAHEQNDQGKLRLHVDTDAPLPIQAALKVESGEFEIWRRVHLVRYMQKSAFGAMSLASVKAFYEPAFLDLEDKTAGVVEYYDAGDWDSRLGAITAGWTATEQCFLDAGASQHAAGSEGVVLRTRADAVAYMVATWPADFPTNTEAEQLLDGQGLTDDDAVRGHFGEIAIAALCKLFDSQLHADDGLNIFHVSRVTAPTDVNQGQTSGLAENFPSAKNAKDGPTRCGFLMMADAPFYVPRAGKTVEQTSAHECGHHMFLPHPRNTAENQGKHANRDYKAHDEAVDDCLMSYRLGVNKLCGFCRLRLRGWNKLKLKTDGALNEKT